MEESVTSPAEKSRKRKIKAELLQNHPFPKHVRWGQRLDNNSSPKLQKLDPNILSTGNESDIESAKDSNSFHGEAVDSVMSSYDEVNTDISYPRTTSSSDDFCTSSSNWGGSSFDVSLYSSDSRSLTMSNPSKTESLYISEEHHCPFHGYEENLLELGSNGDCYCSEYINESAGHCNEMEFDNLLHSNEVASGEYILSSGRWPINQDTQQGETKQLTIDKEFEQYFSMLML
ncbi:hypothetical protein ACJIZ3_022045 [Penstemon smallii]|uniref:Uncharacterized protein n=1 Tax=Penstemon smallii TaxID=265156 RepID=A0ABD3SNU2_9LAMI